MRFMLIVKATKASEAEQMPSPELLQAMGNFNEEMVKAGVMLAGEGLRATSYGARVEFSGAADRKVVKGPFPFSDELIAGFWLIQVASLEEAIDWVKRCPAPHDEETAIEIRRVFDVEDFSEVASPEVIEQEKRLREQTENWR